MNTLMSYHTRELIHELSTALQMPDDERREQYGTRSIRLLCMALHTNLGVDLERDENTK